jgi:hypothetical protein
MLGVYVTGIGLPGKLVSHVLGSDVTIVLVGGFMED